MLTPDRHALRKSIVSVVQRRLVEIQVGIGRVSVLSSAAN